MISCSLSKQSQNKQPRKNLVKMLASSFESDAGACMYFYTAVTFFHFKKFWCCDISKQNHNTTHTARQICIYFEKKCLWALTGDFFFFSKSTESTQSICSVPAVCEISHSYGEVSLCICAFCIHTERNTCKNNLSKTLQAFLCPYNLNVSCFCLFVDFFNIYSLPSFSMPNILFCAAPTASVDDIGLSSWSGHESDFPEFDMETLVQEVKGQFC